MEHFHSDSCRFNRGFYCRVLLLLAALSTLASSVRSTEETEHGVHLSHICVKPEICEPEAGVPVIMLHGLTDIKETWDGIYQEISLSTRRTVCIYDARNHGSSNWNDTFNVDVLAEDLGNFMNMMRIERAVLVGHSMGGRTVMKFAVTNPSKVDRFFVEDIGLTSLSGNAVEGIMFRTKVLLRSLKAIPHDADEATAKKAVLGYLKKFQISNGPTPQHFVKYLPLGLRNGEWQWKSNFDLIRKTMDNPELYFPRLEGGIYEGKALFIYGTASVYKIGDQTENIRKIFPKAEFVGVEGAGHFIHTNHREYMRELQKFLM